jgi:glycosyltransferase involved in cell wall biosynthesis
LGEAVVSAIAAELYEVRAHAWRLPAAIANPPVGHGKSVALVSAVDPYPTDDGKKAVLAGFLEYFIDRLGRNNVHYLIVGGHAERGFPAEIHPLPKPRALAALGSVLTRTGTGRASLQESFLRTAEVSEAIHSTLDRLSPAVELYDTVRMAQYAPDNGMGQQICYLDDLFSRRYGTMLDAADRYPGVGIQPLGNFVEYVPRILRPAAERPRSQRLLLRLEQHLVRQSEDRAAHRFGTTLLISEHEANLLRHRCGADARHVRAVPPLISRRSPIEREYRGAPEFIFLGHLSMPHNADGLRSFLSKVWPLVLAARSDAQLRIVGRYPRPSLRDLIAQHADNVTLEGFVPDLSEMFGRAAAMINPLRFGSGIKVKLIEALRGGVPIISTTIGADGVASGPDQGVLVADDDAELAELLLFVTDTSRNVQLSAAAREHFTRRYSRNAVFACYDAAFGLG